MSVSRRREARLLDARENDLVGRSHRPGLDAVDDAGLSDLIRLLRERRDRARDVSRRQRREVRGKSAPSIAHPATDNSGTREKAALLAAAVKRASKESERRRNARARSKTVSGARRALALKQAANDPHENRPSSRTANNGMMPVPNETIAPSGALNQEGQEIAMRRGGGPR
ncbi:hypothetical protein [Methylobacterium sp. 10]|uniref:hypothetical protein n=1 Tax=Methylobacterium sp. 10 TaxID=1101191 RepID=UPI000486379E|nr:hypothetical protein [Methylobacterium sp. 10]